MRVGLADLKWKGHHTPYVVYLSRYLTERDHRVTFITDTAHGRLDELPDTENLQIRTFDFPKPSGDPAEGLVSSVAEQLVRVRQLRATFGLADEVGVDVLHFLYFDRTQVPLWVTGRLFDGPLPSVVTTLHRDAFTNTDTTSLAKRATLATTRVVLGSSLSTGTVDYLTVHADSIRDRIIDCVEGATHENTKTVPAPTPSLSVDASQPEARAKLGLPSDTPILLFFGGLRDEKGPDLLAEAARYINRPVTIVFAGSEVDFTQDDVDDWKAMVDEPVCIVDRIGFVPESEVDYYFVAADALVLPYRRRRGISGPLRRACMANTPIIGNSDSDVGDIIERHELGMTFRHGSASALGRAVSEFVSGRIDSQDENLSQYAGTHHWTKTGESLEELYRDAIDSAQTGGDNDR